MNRPLIYYSIATFTGSIFAMVLYDNVFIGAVIAASFFTAFFFTVNKKFFVINILFFIVGFFSFYDYFNIKVPNSIEIRITEKNLYSCIGSYKGRKVLISGKINKIEEGTKIKAYGSFEGKMDVSRGIIGNYKITRYDVNNKDYIYKLYEIKRKIYIQYSNSIGENRSALIMALCYGDTRYLSKSQKNEFIQMGVYHAVSVSGFHMAIIYKFLEGILGLQFAIATSFVYVIFTGMQASTVRAFIMILIFKFSKAAFKSYDSISSLSLTALILIVFKPYYVVDIGFTLSFLATLGIILYYKKILRFFYRLPKKVSESLSVTISSQIFSLPYIAFTIQNFSGGFVVGNVFLLPLYSVIVVLGNLALILSFIPIAFRVFSYLLNIILTAVEGANYLILKFCPPISTLTYIEGIAFIVIYLSFIFYKNGYEKAKYLPGFILLLVVFESYSFFPQIYHMDFSKGEGIIIRYKTDNIMVCRYDQASAKEVIDAREKMNVDKIYTNPTSNFNIEFSDNFVLDIIGPSEGESINLAINEGEDKVLFMASPIKKQIVDIYKYEDYEKFPQKHLVSNSLNNKSNLYEESLAMYVIIHNRIFKVY